MSSRPLHEALPKMPSAVIFDFDGVMTDNGVYLTQDGTEAVRCDRGDGMGIEMLRKAGVFCMVLSKEQNPVVAERCKKLQIPCIQGCDDKAPALKALLAEKGLSLEQAVYVGNDINDRACLELVGCGVIVADAHPSVHDVADAVLSKPGGRGAVRELCDAILSLLH